MTLLFHLLLLSITSIVDASPSPSPPDDISRRQWLTTTTTSSLVGVGGAVVYGKLLSDAVPKLLRGDLVYPEAHERQVETVFAQAASAAAAATRSITTTQDRPFRILGVGMGSKWRTLRRGLYQKTLQELSAKGVKSLQLSGLDIVTLSPKVRKDCENRMAVLPTTELFMSVELDVQQASISTSSLPVPDGYYDCVLCTLTLCSVDDPQRALQEMQRILRPNGGTFGYVEHVAVNPDESYRLLDLQQRVLDPLQQVVADNCHLHRFTERTIADVFHLHDDSSKSKQLYSERYLVDDMWPVSCQCSGIVQRNQNAGSNA